MNCRGSCNREPVLSELLEDPIVLLLMRRDGVTPSEVEALMADMPIRSINDENLTVADCACRQQKVNTALAPSY